MKGQNITSFIMVGLVIILFVVDSYYRNKNTVVIPAHYITIISPENEIYSASDTDNGTVNIYYKDGCWVTVQDNEIFSIQQYLVPKDKNGTLYNEVKTLPNFNEADVTYLGFDNATGEILQFNKDQTFVEINKKAQQGVLAYIEWSDDEYYYSYVMQQGDVSILYIYTDKFNLFREYTAFVSSLPSDTSNNGTEPPSPTNSSNVETTISADSSNTANTTVSEHEPEVTETEVK